MEVKIKICTLKRLRGMLEFHNQVLIIQKPIFGLKQCSEHYLEKCNFTRSLTKTEITTSFRTLKRAPEWSQHPILSSRVLCTINVVLLSLSLNLVKCDFQQLSTKPSMLYIKTKSTENRVIRMYPYLQVMFQLKNIISTLIVVKAGLTNDDEIR